MPFIGRKGTQDIAIAAGQSLAVGSYGGGTTNIYYQSASTNSVPAQFYLAATLSDASAVYGPFANATTVRIEGASGCDVEYVAAAAPQLSAANPGQMPTIQMGPNQRFLASVSNGLVAHAGGTQAAGVLCPSDINRFTTVATAGDSSVLPPSAPGMEITVTNAGAASMNVFPSAGGTGTEQINAGGANAAYALAAGKTAQFSCAVAGQWHAILSA